jgi:hypothetical protein
MYDKKKPQNFQDSVNVGSAKYQKTDTPKKSIGGQASMNDIPFRNKTIQKFSKTDATMKAIKTVIKSVL